MVPSGQRIASIGKQVVTRSASLSTNNRKTVKISSAGKTSNGGTLCARVVSEMKNKMALQLKSINECRNPNAKHNELGCAHSKGKPDASPTTIRINVRFATLSPMEVAIKQFAKYSNNRKTVDASLPLMAAVSSTTTKEERMKIKNPLLALSALALMTLAGCGQQPGANNEPAASNPAGEQPAPGAGASNNVVIPSSPTNAPGTNNNPTAPNQ